MSEVEFDAEPEESDAVVKVDRPRRPPTPPNIRAIVWARAAGRCQFRGCNKLLIGDLISGKSNLNASYIAHIVADSVDGPRGHKSLSSKLSTHPGNLMLMCDPHHRLIDGPATRHEYPADLLRDMKAEHEDRIESLTSIQRDRACHVIRFGAGIGRNESPINVDAVKSALLPEFYPVRNGLIDFEVPDLGIPDHDSTYWTLHQRLLREKYQERVRGRLERGEVNRLAVFGLAPIPLLIELGRLISDISEAHVRQLLREPKGWEWDRAEPQLALTSERPVAEGCTVALKLGISARIEDARITSVLGDEVAIWSLSAEEAHNDILRTPGDLSLWRTRLRKMLEEIKDRHGDGAVVHVFPAIPVSAAIELGRVWMPKAHLPMRIYDQNRALGGFRPALDIIHQA
ncbi:Hypothetical protein NGAL_HAMBI2610_36230 [Neorhizobium galegae bv. orientalis]|nr:Hypothetical protein NGAL_HAMBI2610_36230 [Neorhizobium galegae bv. orientalis]